ncbi:hypothetical protein BGX23_002644 [Mortierella sp. AD031]|nr:hypothetical protein BGX23_002644 [Mortierella sp. AD031]
MFHYSGPKKGAPRGYCFLEFETSAQAATAVKQMNRRSLKNRPLIVSLANIAPPSTDPEVRKRAQDPNRPSTFSLLKAGALKNASTDEKIKAMERKLAQMSESPKLAPAPVHSSLPTRPTASSGATSISGASSGQGSHNSHHRGAGASLNSSTRQRPY